MYRTEYIRNAKSGGWTSIWTAKRFNSAWTVSWFCVVV